MSEKLTELVDRYIELTKDTLDFEKFNQYAIVHHSNAIEGSSLTQVETNILLEKNLTPAGKPLADSLMAKDHLAALQHTVSLADQHKVLEVSDIQKLSGMLLKHSHGPMNTPAGNFDPSQGDFRKVGVFAGSTTFVKPEKVVELTQKLVSELNASIKGLDSPEKVYNLAYGVHYQLVNIHPFVDGNGRLSRLMMNYVQRYHKMPLTIVNSADKPGYISALNTSRSQKSIIPFQTFMQKQTTLFLNSQIGVLTKALKLGRKGMDGISFVF